MPLARYAFLRSSSISAARSMASPMGVSPSASSTGAMKASAVTKGCTTFTGPNEITPTSTRLAAIESPRSWRANSFRPALSWAILGPFMEPELSSSSRQAQRGSGLSANSRLSNGTCSSVVMEPSFSVSVARSRATRQIGQIVNAEDKREFLLIVGFVALGDLGAGIEKRPHDESMAFASVLVAVERGAEVHVGTPPRRRHPSFTVFRQVAVLQVVIREPVVTRVRSRAFIAYLGLHLVVSARAQPGDHEIRELRGPGRRRWLRRFDIAAGRRTKRQVGRIVIVEVDQEFLSIVDFVALGDLGAGIEKRSHDESMTFPLGGIARSIEHYVRALPRRGHFTFRILRVAGVVQIVVSDGVLTRIRARALVGNFGLHPVDAAHAKPLDHEIRQRLGPGLHRQLGKRDVAPDKGARQQDRDTQRGDQHVHRAFPFRFECAARFLRTKMGK